MKYKLAGNFSTEALCTRMFERHRATIRVQKPHLAVKKLTVRMETILKLSQEQGFQATSVRDLAQASGVSVSGLYTYFDSKTTLLMMVLGEVSAITTEVLSNVPLALLERPALHLDWLIATHIRLTDVMQPWFSLAFTESNSLPLAARVLVKQTEAQTEHLIAEVLGAGVERHCFDVDDLQLTAGLIRLLLHDWYIHQKGRTPIDV